MGNHPGPEVETGACLGDQRVLSHLVTHTAALLLREKCLLTIIPIPYHNFSIHIPTALFFRLDQKKKKIATNKKKKKHIYQKKKNK